jgi:hypothetical protein
LGNAELKFRQQIRNIDRLLTYDGIIPIKKRSQFEKYANHANPRVRQYVEDVLVNDRNTRQKWHEERRAYESVVYEFSGDELAEDSRSCDLAGEQNQEEIPF